MIESSSKPFAGSATSSTTGPEPNRRWSLAVRLTAWYTGSAFVLILATIAFLYWAVVTTLEREDDQFLLDKAQVLRSTLRESHDGDRELRQQLDRESGQRTTGQLYLRVLTDTGAIVAETPGMSGYCPPQQFAPVVPGRNVAEGIEFRTAAGQTFRGLAIAGPTGRIIQVAMDRTAEEQFLASFRWYTAILLTVALLACGAAGYALARRGLRPLREIAQTANRIRSSTLHKRIDASALPAELADLAGTFNDMLERLQQSFARLDRFSADIAHELRTPLSNLRGEVEVALGQQRSPEEYREVLSSTLEEFARLNGLIDSLLFLARSENPRVEIARVRLDIARELHTVREFFDASAQECGIELTVRAGSGIVAELDRTLLQRAIANLVANALAHTPRGGSITLTATGDANEVRIEVADTGCGITPEHLPHVFERFYRADSARSSRKGSVGLGLSLVKSIAVLHGGTCQLESTPGQGTLVRLTLPARSVQ